MRTVPDLTEDVVSFVLCHRAVGDSGFETIPGMANTDITNGYIECFVAVGLTDAVRLVLGHLALLHHLVEAPEDGLSLSRRRGLVGVVGQLFTSGLLWWSGSVSKAEAQPGLQKE